jgi:hypothetical protein
MNILAAGEYIDVYYLMLFKAGKIDSTSGVALFL